MDSKRTGSVQQSTEGPTKGARGERWNGRGREGPDEDNDERKKRWIRRNERDSGGRGETRKKWEKGGNKRRKEGKLWERWRRKRETVKTCDNERFEKEEGELKRGKGSD